MDIRLHEERITESAGTRRVKTGIYIVLALVFLAAYALFRLDVIDFSPKYELMAQRFSLGAFVALIILAISKNAENYLTSRAKSKADKYNLIRFLRLASILLVVFILISFLFVNWYTAAVSLGLISLILGFALQTPISSFIGWINILIRAPYRVGDRIQINEFRGDVAEINYLDTTLWEFSGDYLTNDIPSGRLIRFPNSLVLESAVYNYSWRKFPYIWNEIPFHVAYESDLAFVEETVRTVAKKELGPQMADKVERFKEIVSQTPVEELNVKEYPFIALRINTNTWVEVSVTYLVNPKEAASIRTRLIKAILKALLAQPDKVMFPKSNAR